MDPGAFVRILLPIHEKLRRPGLLHIGYVLGTTSTGALVACTTSQPWPADIPLPAAARLFDAGEAAALNQSRAFILRLDILAKLPPTATWFPDIEAANRGIVAVAPARLREEPNDLATHLLRRRRSLVQMRGT
jgi:hypothetical protein